MTVVSLVATLEPLSIIGTVLGAAGVLGAASAVLLSSRQTRAGELLRQDNSDLRGRIQTLENLEEACRHELDGAKQQIKGLEASVHTLTETVTGAAALATITDNLARHNDEVTVFWTSVRERLEAIERKLA